MKTLLAILLGSTFMFAACTPQVEESSTDETTKPNAQQEVRQESPSTNQQSPRSN